MMRSIFTILLLSVAHAIQVFAQPGYLLHKTYAERYILLDSVSEKYKDTAATNKFVSEIEAFAKEKNDQELLYSATILKYRHIIERGSKHNMNLQEGMAALIAELESKHLQLLQVEAMNVLAHYYWNDYSTSGIGFDYALRSYAIYSQLPVGELPEKSMLLFDLGINYMRFKDYAGAKQFFIEALNARPLYRIPKEYNILNALGLCYRNTGVYDSAEAYFKSAYALTTPRDSAWQGIITGNIGITYYYEGRYKEAIPLLEKDIDASLKKKQMMNASKSLAVLGDIYLIEGNKGKALELLLQSYNIIKEKGKWNDYETLLQIYPRLAKVYAANGNLQLAYTFLDSAMVMKDSVANQKNFMKLARVQQQQEHEKYEAEAQKLADQQKLHAVIRNSLVGGILLLAVIALLFINRQRLRNNQREQRLRAEKEIAESQQKLAQAELLNASRQLTDFTRNIQEKNVLIEQFSTEIERLQALPCSVDLPDTRENLAKLQQSTILTEDQWEDFRTVFEKVHSGFFIRLKEKLPDLSPAEIRFVALSRLNLNNKEMAGILGISTDAVRMNKHRLKKKLNLPEEESLERLIETI